MTVTPPPPTHTHTHHIIVVYIFTLIHARDVTKCHVFRCSKRREEGENLVGIRTKDYL